MLAEIAKLGFEKRRRRRRDEHLAAVAHRGDACRSVDIRSDVSLLGEERRPRVQPDAEEDRPMRERLRDRLCRGKRPGAVGKARKKASPCVSTSTPPLATQISRTTRLCSASASAYRFAPSLCRSLVEPSTSEKRNVTVPVGRSDLTREIIPLGRISRLDPRLTAESRFSHLPTVYQDGPELHGLRRTPMWLQHLKRRRSRVVRASRSLTAMKALDGAAHAHDSPEAARQTTGHRIPSAPVRSAENGGSAAIGRRGTQACAQVSAVVPREQGRRHIDRGDRRLDRPHSNPPPCPLPSPRIPQG